MTTFEKEIVELEVTANRSWPAREVQNLGGWLLRANDGVTRRANSVLPLGGDGLDDVEAAVLKVREFYSRRGIVPRFQMTLASQPDGLDQSLGELGFDVELKVIIQVAPIESVVHGASDIPVVVNPSPSPEWLTAYAEAGGLDEFSSHVRQGIMERVQVMKGFAEARMDGKIVGIGFGVRDGKWLGLFAIVTQPEYRRRSVATAVSCALTQWGEREGAARAYLQVEEDNGVALKLYEGLGFKNHHKYWYRMQGKTGEND